MLKAQNIHILSFLAYQNRILNEFQIQKKYAYLYFLSYIFQPF